LFFYKGRPSGPFGFPVEAAYPAEPAGTVKNYTGVGF